MKRIFFSMTAAIISVLGLTSFRGIKGPDVTSYFWFYTRRSTTLVILSFDRFAPTGTGPCVGAVYFCEVGYTIGQVNTNGLGVVTSVQSGQTNSFKVVERQP